MTAFGRRVEAKLGSMRKPQSFIVQPMSDGRIMVQSDKRIGVFDFRTREGVLSTKGPHFPHLTAALGAVRYTFPAEFVAECLDACPTLDGETTFTTARGAPILTVAHTVQVID